MNTNLPVPVRLMLNKADVAGGASEELVSSVERQHGLKFPEEYRTFLLQYGAALLPGFEIYGLLDAANSSEPPLWTDIRRLLESPVFKKMPADLVPLSDDGGDYRFYLQCGSSGRGNIVVYGPGRDGTTVSEGFFDFIERALGRGLDSMLV